MRRGAYLPRDYGINQLSSTNTLDPLLKASERQNAQAYRDELLRQMQEQKANKDRDRLGTIENPYGNGFLPPPNRARSQSFGAAITSGPIAPVSKMPTSTDYISPVLLMAKDPPANLHHSSSSAYAEELKKQMESNRLSKELEKKREQIQEEKERRRIEQDIAKWKAEEDAEAQRQREKLAAQQRRAEALARASEMSQSFTAVKPALITTGGKKSSDGLEWWERKQNKTKLTPTGRFIQSPPGIGTTTSTFLPTADKTSPFGQYDFGELSRVPRSFSTSPVAGHRQPLEKSSRQSSALRRNEETLRQMSARRERLQKEQQRVSSALGRRDYGSDVFNSDEEDNNFLNSNDNSYNRKPASRIADLSGIITPPPARKISTEPKHSDLSDFPSYPVKSQSRYPPDDEDSPLVKLIKNSRTRLDSPQPRVNRANDIRRSLTDEHIRTGLTSP